MRWKVCCSQYHGEDLATQIPGGRSYLIVLTPLGGNRESTDFLWLTPLLCVGDARRVAMTSFSFPTVRTQGFHLMYSHRNIKTHSTGQIALEKSNFHSEQYINFWEHWNKVFPGLDLELLCGGNDLLHFLWNQALGRVQWVPSESWALHKGSGDVNEVRERDFRWWLLFSTLDRSGLCFGILHCFSFLSKSQLYL
jgi:hypothetical protein